MPRFLPGNYGVDGQVLSITKVQWDRLFGTWSLAYCWAAALFIFFRLLTIRA
jgi:hypothetical protein